MDMGRFLIETHLRTGRPIKELAKAHDVSAGWLFKLLRRYRLEGPARPGATLAATTPLADPHRRCLRGRDRGGAQGAGRRRTRCRCGHDPLPPGAALRNASVDLHNLSGLKGPGVRRPLTPEASEELVQDGSWPTLPNETWQADMTHVEFGGGAGLRGAQHDRRPLEAVRGLESHESGQGQRCRPGAAQSGRDQGVSGLFSH